VKFVDFARIEWSLFGQANNKRENRDSVTVRNGTFSGL
jgi:hypothetical protein